MLVTGNGRSTKAVGTMDKRGHGPKISIGFDQRTFDIIAQEALKRGVSFGVIVRELVKRGLGGR